MDQNLNPHKKQLDPDPQNMNADPQPCRGVEQAGVYKTRVITSDTWSQYSYHKILYYIVMYKP